MNDSDYKGLNAGKEHAAAAAEAGIWADTTTKPNRYSGYVEAVVQLAEEGYLQPGQELTVLDIGASTGKATEGFEKAVEYHTGLAVDTVSYDLNRAALEHNRDNQRSDGYIQGTAEELPFADGAFDIVLSKTLLSRLNGDHQARALQEINRVLDDDGVAAVEVDPDGKPRAYSGKERILKAPLFDQAARASDGFSAYPLDLEPWAEDREQMRDEEELRETVDTGEQYGDVDDDAEIITASIDAGEQYDTSFEGAVVL